MWVAIILLAFGGVCLAVAVVILINTGYELDTRVQELERQITAMYEPLVERPVIDEPLFFDLSYENNANDYEEDVIGKFDVE